MAILEKNSLSDLIHAGDIKVRTIHIDPELAEALLNLNTKNRKVRRSEVNKLVYAMRNGEWKPALSNIVLSKTGCLLDGQHRLTAVKHSGTTQVFNVVTGCDDDDQRFIDQGLRRSVPDQLAIDGYPSSTHLAKSARVALDFQNGLIMNNEAKYTNNQVYEFAVANFDVLNQLYNFTVKMQKKAKFLSAAFMVGHAFEAYRQGHSENFISDFLESACERKHMRYHNACLLFDLSLQQLSSPNPFRPLRKMAYYCKAFNQDYLGKKNKRLIVKDSEVNNETLSVLTFKE